MADIEEKTHSINELEAQERTEGASKHFSPALANAIKESNIKPWSRNTLQLYAVIFCGICCAYANGYDGSLMTAIEAMPFWQRHFGNLGTTGTLISVIFSIYNIGSFIGGPPAAFLTDHFGRRKAMAAGALVIIVGSVVVTTSNHIGQFIAGRFILGFGISIVQLAAPSYVMEIAPPHWRGRCTAIYNCGWYGGAIPAAAITFGTNYIKSNLSWQIPIILQCAACLFVLILCPFIPESPRFLMAKGREEDAHTMLTKYHGGGDPNNALVLLEMEEMRQANDDHDDAAWWDYRILFSTRGNRWRTLQVSMMAVFGHFSGNGLAYFATVIFAQIGVSSVTAQLGYNLMYSSLAMVGAFVGALLTDHMPRRKVLTFGTLALSCILAIFVGLNTVIQDAVKNDEPINDKVGRAAIAVYMIFGIACAFTYTPLQATVTVEALTTPMRAKGLAWCNVLTQAMGFINMFAGPIALHNIKLWYILFFVFWDAFEAVCWWFLGVEAQGRTLEELDWVYSQPNPVKASKKLD